MKKGVLALSGILLSLNIHAQITLTNSSFTSTIAGTVDTFLTPGPGCTYPNTSPTANGFWDMSTAVIASPASYGYNTSPYTAAFPLAQFADSQLRSFSAYFYITEYQMGFTSSALSEFGQHIARQALHLAGGTFGPTDSLIYNAQDIVYSSAYNYLTFPATYHTAWSSVFHLDFNVTLDIAIAGYSNTPGIIREYVTELDTVVGWGQMRVKKTDGTAGDYMHVLQVRTRWKQTDSFYINGTPASPAELASLGLTQGQVSANYIDLFYRPGEWRPLAAVVYTDSTFLTPGTATTLAQNFNTDITAVRGTAGNEKICVYPNPITDGIINIDMPAGYGRYELINMAGETVMTGYLHGSTTTLKLPATATPGIYYIRLKGNGNEVVRALEVR